MIWTLDTAKKEHQFSPALANALVNILPRKYPVYDFGCGKGSYLKVLKQNNFVCKGFEGTPDIDQIADFSPIFQADLSKPFDTEISLETIHRGSVVCLEVAEHIHESFESVFLDNITRPAKKYLILSWAVPGQGGCGHVNERPDEYVIPMLMNLGFKYNYLMSEALRKIAGAELWWFNRSIYVFTR